VSELPYVITWTVVSAMGSIGLFLLGVLIVRQWPTKTAPAEQRAAVHQAGPPHAGVCPICGMGDPDHLEARWRTHPVHADCLEWLMPGGPSFVDEYANPVLSDGGGRRKKPCRYPTKGGHMSGDATIYDLPPIPEWLMEKPPIEVTTMGDPEPVYLESRKP
jgi:hypothetical protein